MFIFFLLKELNLLRKKIVESTYRRKYIRKRSDPLTVETLQ